MPLEGIHALFYLAKSGQYSPLLPWNPPTGDPSPRIIKSMVYVTREFFVSSPNGISPNSVTDDILGFFSLILTYAKQAHKLEVNKSMKFGSTIMPRSNFRTIYQQIERKIPRHLNLYDLVKILACYENNAETVE